MTLKQVKTLFWVAAIYDIVLGVGFGLLYKPIYAAWDIELPNHAGYIQLAALYVLIFGIAFLYVARDPVKNRALIVTGILMKLAFVAVTAGHLIADTIPVVYIPFAVLDLFFLVLFLAANGAMRRLEART